MTLQTLVLYVAAMTLSLLATFFTAPGFFLTLVVMLHMWLVQVNVLSGMPPEIFSSSLSCSLMFLNNMSDHDGYLFVEMARALYLHGSKFIVHVSAQFLILSWSLISFAVTYLLSLAHVLHITLYVRM